MLQVFYLKTAIQYHRLRRAGTLPVIYSEQPRVEITIKDITESNGGKK